MPNPEWPNAIWNYYTQFKHLGDETLMATIYIESASMNEEKHMHDISA